MGLRIGDEVRALPEGSVTDTRLRRSDAVDPGATTRRREILVYSRLPSDSPAAVFSRSRPDPPQVGFGTGTVSTAAAAIRTLDRNFEAARQTVPTFDEVRDRLAEDRAERDAGEAERTARAEALRETLSFGRNFVSEVNRRIEVVQARLAGEEPPPPAGLRQAVRVGGEEFNLRLPEGTRFDVSI